MKKIRNSHNVRQTHLVTPHKPEASNIDTLSSVTGVREPLNLVALPGLTLFETTANCLHHTEVVIGNYASKCMMAAAPHG